MKLNLALILILVVSAVVFFKPFGANTPTGMKTSLVNQNLTQPPSKPELQEEMLVAGTADANAGEVVDEILAGYQVAQQEEVTSHANCIIIENASKKLGCHRYVNDQKLVPPYINRENSLENISANQCLAETTAYYEAVEKDMRQQAMAEPVLSQLKTDWQTELAACNKYPYKALSLEELQPIILGVEKTGDVKPEDLHAVLIDIAEKGMFADAVVRADYISNVENLFPTVTNASPAAAINCELHKQKIDALSAALGTINAFKQDKLELWSSVVLQRKVLLWKKLLLSSEAACEVSPEQ